MHIVRILPKTPKVRKRIAPNLQNTAPKAFVGAHPVLLSTPKNGSYTGAMLSGVVGHFLGTLEVQAGSPTWLNQAIYRKLDWVL